LPCKDLYQRRLRELRQIGLRTVAETAQHGLIAGDRRHLDQQIAWMHAEILQRLDVTCDRLQLIERVRFRFRENASLRAPQRTQMRSAAETLAEFRGRYRYNLLDTHVRRFNAYVPIMTQWDDHEVTNNWSPSKQLPAAYRERDITLLAARAARAFHEMYPIRESIVEPGRVYRTLNYGPHLDVFMLDERSYRGPNGANQQTTYGPDSYFIGPDQLAWLKRVLINSRATWKVIASDMPLSLVVYDDAANKKGSEAFAQGDGPPRGRELEIAELLRFIKTSGVVNTVWLTADVHYTAAHYYNPDKAQFGDFEPFW